MKFKLVVNLLIFGIVGCSYTTPTFTAKEYHVQIGLARHVGQEIVIDTPEKERLWRLAATRAYNDAQQQKIVTDRERLKAMKAAAWEGSVEQRQAHDIDIAYKIGKITKSQYEVMRNQLNVSFHHKFELDRKEDAKNKAIQVAYERSLRQRAKDLEEEREARKWEKMGEKVGELIIALEDD